MSRMARDLILAIDAGTSVIKVLAFDLALRAGGVGAGGARCERQNQRR